MKRLCIKCRKEPALIEPGPEGHPICRGVCASCRRIIESGDLQTVHEILDSLHAPILLLHSRRYFSITTERLDDFILLRLDKVQLAGINKGNRPPPMSWAAHSCGLAPTPSPGRSPNQLLKHVSVVPGVLPFNEGQGFRQQGSYFYHTCRGLDFRPVEPARETKSLGHEETFNTDLTDPARLHKELLSLAERVAGRLRHHELAGKVLTLKVKYGDFKQITRSTTLPRVTDDAGEIMRQATLLLQKTDAGNKSARLLGISLAGFDVERTTQLDLFAKDEDLKKRKRINKALDAIKEKYGATSILPGTLLE